MRIPLWKLLFHFQVIISSCNFIFGTHWILLDFLVHLFYHWITDTSTGIDLNQYIIIIDDKINHNVYLKKYALTFKKVCTRMKNWKTYVPFLVIKCNYNFISDTCLFLWYIYFEIRLPIHSSTLIKTNISSSEKKNQNLCIFQKSMH